MLFGDVGMGDGMKRLLYRIFPLSQVPTEIAIITFVVGIVLGIGAVVVWLVI